MPFAAWWREDPFPELSPLPTFSARVITDVPFIARLNQISEPEVTTRIQSGNVLYMAFMGDSPAAYGWVAFRSGGIADLQFSFQIPPGNCYLWDFLTLPEWRGHGIYPLLIRAIIDQLPQCDRFWIGYAPGNDASSRGITKSGFHVAGEYFVNQDFVISGLELFDTSKYALASPDFYGLPIVVQPKGSDR